MMVHRQLVQFDVKLLVECGMLKDLECLSRMKSGWDMELSVQELGSWGGLDKYLPKVDTTL